MLFLSNISLYFAGKTSILVRFNENTFNPKNSKTTIGVDYKAKEMIIDGENVKLQIWDTAGQERFRSMTSAFYNKAQGVVLTFDVSQEQSYQSLDTWVRDIRQFSPPGVVIILCANKADLPTEKWAVSREEFKVYASERGLVSFECSASSGLNVTEIFNELGREVLKNSKSILQKVDEPAADKGENLVLFDSPAKKEKKGCC